MIWIILLLTMLTVSRSIVSGKPTIDEMIYSMQGECDAIGEIVNNLGDNDENPYQSINKVCKDGLNAIKYVYTDLHGIKGKNPLMLTIDNQQVQVERPFLRNAVKKNEFKVRFDDLINDKHEDNPKDAQKIVDKIIQCNKFKKKRSIEKCVHNLYCMKKRYILDNGIDFENNKDSFPIMYKGVEAFTQTPPDMKTNDCPNIKTDDKDEDDDVLPAATDPPQPEHKEPETKATDIKTENSSSNNKEVETEPQKEVKPKLRKKKKVVKKTDDTTPESNPSGTNKDGDDSDEDHANNGSVVKKEEDIKDEPIKHETKIEDSKPETQSPVNEPEKIVTDTKKEPENIDAETESPKEVKPKLRKKKKVVKKTGDTTPESNPSGTNKDGDDSDEDRANNGSVVKKEEDIKQEPIKPETKIEDSTPETQSPVTEPEKIVTDTKKEPENINAETESPKEVKPKLRKKKKVVKKTGDTTPESNPSGTNKDGDDSDEDRANNGSVVKKEEDIKQEPIKTETKIEDSKPETQSPVKEPEKIVADTEKEPNNKVAETEPPKEEKPKLKKKKKVVKNTALGDGKNAPDGDDSDDNQVSTGNVVKNEGENKEEPVTPKPKADENKQDNTSPAREPEKLAASEQTTLENKLTPQQINNANQGEGDDKNYQSDSNTKQVAEKPKQSETPQTESEGKETKAPEALKSVLKNDEKSTETNLASSVEETKKYRESESSAAETKAGIAKGSESEKTNIPETSETPSSKGGESVSITNSQQDSTPKDSTKDSSTNNDKNTEKPVSEEDIQYEPVEDEKPDNRFYKKPSSVTKSLFSSAPTPTPKSWWSSGLFSANEPPTTPKPVVQVAPTPTPGGIRKHTDSDYINPYEVSQATKLVIRTVIHVIYSTMNSWRRKPLDSNGRLRLNQFEAILIDSLAERINIGLMKMVFNDRVWTAQPSSYAGMPNGAALMRQGSILQPGPQQQGLPNVVPPKNNGSKTSLKSVLLAKAVEKAIS